MNKENKNKTSGLKPPAWLNKQERQKIFDDHVDASDSAYFGFHRHRAADKVKTVLSHFNRVAPKYDLMNSVLSFWIHHAWKRMAIRMLDLQPGDQILDVCGGTGDLAVLSAKRIGIRGNVFIYDINRAMMKAGKIRPENIALQSSIHYIEGDAERIACPDNRFDAAMVGFGIRNLTHLQLGYFQNPSIRYSAGCTIFIRFRSCPWQVP